MGSPSLTSIIIEKKNNMFVQVMYFLKKEKKNIVKILWENGCVCAKNQNLSVVSTTFLEALEAKKSVKLDLKSFSSVYRIDLTNDL